MYLCCSWLASKVYSCSDHQPHELGLFPLLLPEPHTHTHIHTRLCLVISDAVFPVSCVFISTEVYTLLRVYTKILDASPFSYNRNRRIWNGINSELISNGDPQWFKVKTWIILYYFVITIIYSIESLTLTLGITVLLSQLYIRTASFLVPNSLSRTKFVFSVPILEGNPKPNVIVGQMITCNKVSKRVYLRKETGSAGFFKKGFAWQHSLRSEGESL